MNGSEPILLTTVLRDRRLTRYGSFCAAYEKSAQNITSSVSWAPPSRAQFHRWVSGDLKRLPNTDHCRVLEGMFPEWTAEELFSPAPETSAPPSEQSGDVGGAPPEEHLPRAGITAAFASRAEFAFAMPPHTLFQDARRVQASGLSLNLICQQHPEEQLVRMIEDGAELHCLFLDPDGTAIAAREREERHRERHLATLTRLNIEVLWRLRERLSEEARDRLTIGVYDEVVRFNLILIDGSLCIMQPYLPGTRGLDSPTLVIRRTPACAGMYETFDQVFTTLAERSRLI